MENSIIWTICGKIRREKIRERKNKRQRQRYKKREKRKEKENGVLCFAP